MNMTIAELLEKLLAKNVLVTYEGDETQYIDGDCMVNVDGNFVNGVLKYESGAVSIEFEDTSCNQYDPAEVVPVYFYRLEEL